VGHPRHRGDQDRRERHGRRRPRIRVHRVSTLKADEVTDHRAIPVTTPARTLLDLAASLPRRALERALDQAEILDLFDLSSLTALARTHAGERGAQALTRALTEHEAGTTVTRSELEELFLSLCINQGLERPRPGARVAGLEVDFLFPTRRLVVELDGYRYHRTRKAFERDRERDAILAAAGLRTLRFTHRQLTRRPQSVLAALRSSA
jgi:very-short-patch-repair endonuclease